MDKAVIERYANALNSLANDADGVEFWYARDVMKYMNYSEWRAFAKAIDRAKSACDNSGIPVDSHFQDIERDVMIGSGAKRPIRDVRMTRYACYLLAQNGDPRKEEVALLQSYFAVQTRTAEILGQRMAELSRIAGRHALAAEERLFTKLGFQHGLKERDFGSIRSHGDRSLFDMDTTQMKLHLGVSQSEPLADHLHPINVTAKQLATQMTNFSIEQRNLHGVAAIDYEHSGNNKAIRKTLLERGIAPEDLPAAEDIKRVESRTREDEKRIEGSGFGSDTIHPEDQAQGK